QEDEPVGIGVRQRPEQDRVDEAEDGAVGADAESEGEEGHEREAAPLRQHPRPKLHVLPESLHGLTSRRRTPPWEPRHEPPRPGGGLPSLALLPRLRRRAQSGGHSLARQGLETLAVGVAHGPRAAGEDLERAPALERERRTALPGPV